MSARKDEYARVPVAVGDEEGEDTLQLQGHAVPACAAALRIRGKMRLSLQGLAGISALGLILIIWFCFDSITFAPPMQAPVQDGTVLLAASAHTQEQFERAAGDGAAATGVLFLGGSDIERWQTAIAFPPLRHQRCGVGGDEQLDSFAVCAARRE